MFPGCRRMLLPSGGARSFHFPLSLPTPVSQRTNAQGHNGGALRLRAKIASPGGFRFVPTLHILSPAASFLKTAIVKFIQTSLLLFAAFIAPAFSLHAQVADDPTGILLKPIPDKLIVLTFDDAPASHATVVAPILKELGFGGTMYVCDFDSCRTKTWPGKCRAACASCPSLISRQA